MSLFAKLFGDKYERHMKKANHFYTKPIDEETWNLDLCFVDFMVPRLRLFKEKASNIIDYDFTIIDKIIEGFELYRHHYDWEDASIKENLKKVQKSMRLFAEHWMEFWW